MKPYNLAFNYGLAVKVLDKESLPLEYNDDFWEKRYGLRIDKIPTFLQETISIEMNNSDFLEKDRFM